MSIRYAPGPAFALVRPGWAVLVDASVGTAVAAELWTAVHAADVSAWEQGCDLATLLDAVTAVLDPTWRALPAFAIALVHPAADPRAAVPGSEPGTGLQAGDEGRWAAQIAVRGDFTATVTTATATERISGPTVTTWVDKRIGDVVHVQLVAGAGAGDAGANGADEPVLCITDGVVPAGTLSWDLHEGARASSTPARVGAVVTLSAAPELEAETVVVVDEAAAAALEESGTPAAVEPDRAEGAEQTYGVGSIDDIESDFARTLASFPEVWEDKAEPASGDEGLPDGRNDSNDSNDSLVELDHAEAYTLDTISSRSALRTAVAAAGAALDAAESAARNLAAAGSGAIGVPLGTLNGPDGPDSLGVRDVRVSQLSQPDAEADEFDDTTVFASAIAQLKSGAQPGAIPPPPPPPPAPQIEPFREPARQGTEVLARSCFFSHANPPARSTCAQCGGGLSPTTQLVERPSLGRVEVSTGESIDLSVPVVVGRFPQAQATVSPVAQRLVTVPSPNQDISRSHLEIRLDGWHVLLVDLDTVNGTTLLRAGQPPRRLHPSEPTLVAVGDVADLGDGVTLTFRELI